MNLSGGIRMGLLLEDLDSLAGEIAYRHTEGFNPARPVTIVTASVDRLEVNESVLPYFDLRLDGRVTWTGRSSMEIRINLDSLVDGEWKTCMRSCFTMVAREKHGNSAAPIHSIEPQTEEEKELFNMGEENRQRRKLVAEHSLEKKPPNDEERDLIHSIFIKLREQERRNMNVDLSQWLGSTSELEFENQHCKFIDSTVLKNTLLMFMQQRNIHGKIFGGYLLRQAYELAFSCATLFLQTRPSFLSLDDNAFLKPVEVGTIVSFTAAIVYTGKSTMQVRVEVEVINPQLGSRETTNVFHFAFSGPVRNKVLPRTYEEAILFLEGRRIHEKGKEMSKRLKGKLIHSQ
jgi:acyl-coenzyme A thioesterase 9